MARKRLGKGIAEQLQIIGTLEKSLVAIGTLEKWLRCHVATRCKTTGLELL